MTREEAIQVFNTMKSTESYTALIELCNMAIEALQEVPKRRKEAKRWKRKALQADRKERVMTDDLISRQDVIDTIIAEGRTVDSRYLESERIVHECDAVEALAMLPSARLTGKWMFGNGNGECPFCHHERQHGWDNFCGFCGADMRGSDSE